MSVVAPNRQIEALQLGGPGIRPAAQLALFGSGSFLLVGLLTGVWKYAHIRATADGAASAPTYVDIAHRASLLYAVAALVLFELATVAPFGEPVTVAAVAPGLDPRLVTGAMVALIVAEVGGAGLLLVGFLVRYGP